jgi:hypothetical protein
MDFVYRNRHAMIPEKEGEDSDVECNLLLRNWMR